MKPMKVCVGFVLVFALSGCNAIQNFFGGQSGSQSMGSACQSNPYLSKYNCSTSQIKKAAQHGDPDAQYALGYMYYYGISVGRNTSSAKSWINKAASKGQPLAIRARNMMQANGYRAPASGGVKQSKADVEEMNAQIPSEPLESRFPNYKKENATSEPVIKSLQ